MVDTKVRSLTPRAFHRGLLFPPDDIKGRIEKSTKTVLVSLNILRIHRKNQEENRRKGSLNFLFSFVPFLLFDG